MAEKETKNPPQDDDEDMSSDDEEYIPKEEPEELEERALDAKFEVAEDDPDDPESSKAGKAAAGSKRKAGDAGLIAGRARMRGGIRLEDEEDVNTAVAREPAEEDDGEEEEEAAKPAVEAPKPKSKVDDMWEEMKRGAVEKKPKPSGNINSFIQGLVSKAGGSTNNIAGPPPHLPMHFLHHDWR
eukprot:1720506-Rhodomonas_salina.1